MSKQSDINQPDLKKEKIDAAASAGMGAVAGAGVSLLLGGMGLAVGGTAVAIGLPIVAGAGAIVGLAGYGLKKSFGRGSRRHRRTRS